MSACRHARKQMWASLEGRPPRGWLGDHLEACPACAVALARLRHETRALRASAEAPPVPDADALWARIEPRLPRRRPFYLLVLAPFAPAALALALWLSYGPAQPPSGRGGGEVAAAHGGAASLPAGITRAPDEPGPAPAKASAPVHSRAKAGSGRQRRALREAPRRARAPARPGASQRPGTEERVRRRGPVVVALAGSARAVTVALARPLGARAFEGAEALRATAGPPAARAAAYRASVPPVPAPRPVAAVVVMAADGAGSAANTLSFCRSEATDPESGMTSRLVVTREIDESGRTRQVTIDYEGGLRPYGG